MLINAFFYSHFNYCPLIWMFSSKASNDRIEKLHKRALRIIDSDFTATYEKFIAIDESITIHKRNLQFLMTEIYKTLHDLNPPFMKEIFVRLDTSFSKVNRGLKLIVLRHLYVDLKLFPFGEVKSGILWGIVLNNYQVQTHLSRKSNDGMVQTARAKSAHDP